MNEHDTIRALEAENTLMNELVSDLRKEVSDTQEDFHRMVGLVKDREKTILSLQREVNRLSRALVDRGVSVTEVRNIASG